ncbi:phage head closure protein [Salmonella enterica]|nr:head-tail adaptor protein [Salmonella enterica]ECE5619019.1 head-tail adaptor protein [Salmonella enterica subsp. enterica serovar Liverpool]HED1840919.1 phage head closure protein [Citrobacter freundii]EAM8581013.1 head-tail adaptor protein [Salmonella enterica]EAX5240193.1 head-tail adaptor protein [Salmonella enterica]
MNSLRAGELNKRIRLEKLETQRGSLGEPLPSITVDVATVWAKAENVSNRKIRTLDQQQVVETWLFTIRSRKDVQTDWKIVWGDEVYTVRAADCSQSDRTVITAERDNRHDRAGN